MPRGRDDSATFVLGAGASRSVTNANQEEMPSPLDRDFFDLLQRLEPREKDEPAVAWILQRMSELPYDYRRSLEKAFYTLHLRAYLRRKLGVTTTEDEENDVVANFARGIDALLRKAHGTRFCKNHSWLLSNLTRKDAIISFNYDLVVERSLRFDA